MHAEFLVGNTVVIVTSSTPEIANTTETIAQLLTVAQDRLRELEPVAAEIAQLQRVVTVLSEPGADEQLGDLAMLLDVTASLPRVARVPTTSAGSSRRLSPKRGRDGRAPQGANKALILSTIEAHPGIRPTAIADVTGLKPTVVSATVNRLKRQGQLEPEGKGVRVRRASVAA